MEKGKVYYFDLLSAPNWWDVCIKDEFIKDYYIKHFGVENWPMTEWRIMLPIKCGCRFIEGCCDCNFNYVLTSFENPIIAEYGAFEIEIPFKKDWYILETQAITCGANDAFIREILEKVFKEYSRRYYKNFLKSDYWKKLRKQCFERDDFRCVKCGSAKNLNAHHLNYDNIGKPEELDDLVTLCGECHTKIHQTDIERKAYEEKSSNNDL